MLPGPFQLPAKVLFRTEPVSLTCAGLHEIDGDAGSPH